jgi:hypothetical protein
MNTHDALSPAAQWFQQQVQAVEADLLAAIEKHPDAGLQVTAYAIIDFAGRMLSAIGTIDPASRADIESKLGELRLFVTRTDGAPQ